MKLYKSTLHLHFEDCFFANYFDVVVALNHSHCSSFSIYFHLQIFMSQPRCLLINLDDVRFCLAGRTDDFRVITGLGLIYENSVNVLQAA